MKRSVASLLVHFCLAALLAPLLGAFWMQFGRGEFPCPLCILQRMAMLLAALGPAWILYRAKEGPVQAADLATGAGMAVSASVVGIAVAVRQVLLHIVPPDPGYGAPVLGLHLYTWSVVIFLAIMAVSGLGLLFPRELAAQGVRYGRASKVLLGLLAALILANALAVFAEEGFHLFLPDDPVRYELFH
ncbi:MAG TPA: disulfide bond formation protein B [Holophagaceae bacterium]|nr:disulfide bond formation protein B [Holophagaceae bacterium]